MKNIYIFRPKKIHYSLFLSFVLKNPAIIEQLLLMSPGASQQFIGIGVARGFRILNPGSALLDLFGEKVIDVWNQIKNLQKINKSLEVSKEILLPRLISGKLSVENLDIQFPLSMLEEDVVKSFGYTLTFLYKY